MVLFICRICFLLCLVVHSSAVSLEATLIAVDNSAYMINGDHRPDRLTCQYECVNLICNVKVQNPENTIGLMAMACPQFQCPQVHVTPATNQDVGAILLKLDQINTNPGNTVRFESAMKVGWMSLKNRMNKNQRPRIVAFVGSPLCIDDAAALIRWAKRLRKNSVAVRPHLAFAHAQKSPAHCKRYCSVHPFI